MSKQRDSILQRVRHIYSRVRGIASFVQAGRSLPDKVKMALVGYARGHNFGGNDLIGRIGRKLCPAVSLRLDSLGDLVLHLDLCDLSQLSVADEIFIQKIYDLEIVPFAPDLVVDCGAHVGMFTLLASNRFPKSKIVAFEADPENCRWLRRQIEENHLSVDVIEAAVWMSEGQALFEAGHGCGSLLSESSSASSTAIRVKSVDLADYLVNCGAENLLLKLDVEGAEESVLPRVVDVLPKNCFVFLETHRGKESWDLLSGVLQDRGFETSVTRARADYTDGIAIRSSSIRAA